MGCDGPQHAQLMRRQFWGCGETSGAHTTVSCGENEPKANRFHWQLFRTISQSCPAYASLSPKSLGQYYAAASQWEKGADGWDASWANKTRRGSERSNGEKSEAITFDNVFNFNKDQHCPLQDMQVQDINILINPINRFFQWTKKKRKKTYR